jgi:pimeloyl-ACP methyl ester carboxylesterase
MTQNDENGETTEPEFLEVGDRRIAVRYRPGKMPGIVWLGGYRSDMRGTKAERLDAMARETGHACLRHDYSGHGESGGAFQDGTISCWLEESLAVFRRFAEGPQVLVGSSMGGWIALRMVEELRKSGDGGRLAGLVLIAPAPDFTRELIEPEMSEAQQKALAEQGYFEVPSEYSPEPDIYTRALIEDGAKNLVLKGIVETGCPVHVLQGMEDEDVPYRHALKLVEHLPVDDVTITLVRDGDHRLSRPQDLDLLERTVAGLLERAPSSA